MTQTKIHEICLNELELIKEASGTIAELKDRTLTTPGIIRKVLDLQIRISVKSISNLLDQIIYLNTEKNEHDA